jgi:hypothetical protein
MLSAVEVESCSLTFGVETAGGVGDGLGGLVSVKWAAVNSIGGTESHAAKSIKTQSNKRKKINLVLFIGLNILTIID